MTHPSQGKDINGGVYGTPMDFLRAVDRYWPIGFDLAADLSNEVFARLYGQVGNFYGANTLNSLDQTWSNIEVGHRWLYLNPPFSHIDPWAAKCAEESAKGARILFLVPQGSQAWNRKHCQGKSLELRLDGRLTFVGQKDPYPKDLSLFVFGGGLVGTGFWRWR